MSLTATGRGLKHKQKRKPKRREDDNKQILKMSAIISTNGLEGREINALAVNTIE